MTPATAPGSADFLMSDQRQDLQTRADPLGSFDLDTLLAGAARLRGDRKAIADGSRSLSFEELDRQANAVATQFGALGLGVGECVLLVAGLRVSAIVGIIAGLRAGLQVALAPAHIDAASLAACAGDVSACVLIADRSYGKIAPLEACFEAALLSPRVRMISTLRYADDVRVETAGADLDGVVVIDPAALAARDTGNANSFGLSRIATRLPIVTFGADGSLIAHDQRTLVAAGLDFVAKARVGMRLPIITTLAPSSFAGLVAGPFASLLAGAPLLLHGPFDAAAFVQTIDSCEPAHVIVPSSLLPMCEAAGLVRATRIASLVLVSRAQAASHFLEPPSFAAGLGLPPVIDLYAIGEIAAIAEARPTSGRPAALLPEPHVIALEDQRILVAGWAEDGMEPSFEGAGISGISSPYRAS